MQREQGTGDMGDKLNIKIIVGSTREGRFGKTVAEWIHGIASQREDMSTEVIDLRDWPLPFFESARSPASGILAEEARAWSELIGCADGFVIIAAEYNHGYTAVLKNALDHLYHEWCNKPVGFVSYGGASGGSRSVEQLRLVAIELQMAPIREAVVIPMARNAFGEDGQPLNTATNDRATAVLDQLAWWATALKNARNATSLAR
jgi:NAD(P)H-dependent FMN reductase